MVDLEVMVYPKCQSDPLPVQDKRLNRAASIIWDCFSLSRAVESFTQGEGSRVFKNMTQYIVGSMSDVLSKDEMGHMLKLAEELEGRI